MTKRTVQSGMVTYLDPSGERRIGTAGEQVDVHADDLARFDRIDGTAPEAKPVPKRRGRPPRA